MQNEERKGETKGISPDESRSFLITFDNEYSQTEKFPVFSFPSIKYEQSFVPEDQPFS